MFFNSTRYIKGTNVKIPDDVVAELRSMNFGMVPEQVSKADYDKAVQRIVDRNNGKKRGLFG